MLDEKKRTFAEDEVYNEGANIVTITKIIIPIIYYQTKLQ